MNFSVKNGCFGYSNGKQILNDINFSVDEKEILSILGSNGVGKTTLLKCTLGLLNWRSGETLIDGKNIKIGNKNFAGNNQIKEDELFDIMDYTIEKI